MSGWWLPVLGGVTGAACGLLTARRAGFRNATGARARDAHERLRAIVSEYQAEWAAAIEPRFGVAVGKSLYHAKNGSKLPRSRGRQFQFAVAIVAEVPFLLSRRQQSRIMGVLSWLVGPKIVRDSQTFYGARTSDDPTDFNSLELIHQLYAARDQRGLGLMSQDTNNFGAITATSSQIDAAEKKAVEAQIGEALTDIVCLLDSRRWRLHKPPFRPAPRALYYASHDEE